MQMTYCYDDAAKQKAANTYKRALRKVAAHLIDMGGCTTQFDLRFNPGGIAVWGEVTLHTETRYIQASHGCDLGVLVRTCKGRKDYTGGMNHWLPFSMLLNNPEGFAARVKGIR